MEKIVFTNGCFDLIHPGHIDLLRRARDLGTKLIVGINSDSSVRAIKGPPRPFMSERDRMDVLLGLGSVDEVRIFPESTPENLIREILPDVLVKGGDWRENEIVGADLVRKNGGEVHSLPFLDGYSTSAMVERIRGEGPEIRASDSAGVENAGIAANSLASHIDVFKSVLASETSAIEACGELIVEALAGGKKILICGNGGSAADAQHIAAELVGRYELERRGLPAIALTTDTSALTALANDYSFERVFARQVEALAVSGDVLIAISTSGNSPNIIAAVMAARETGCGTIGLTGANGRKLAAVCDKCIMVPAVRTARIQEAHIAIGHIWCEIVDVRMFG